MRRCTLEGTKTASGYSWHAIELFTAQSVDARYKVKIWSLDDYAMSCHYIAEISLKAT